MLMYDVIIVGGSYAGLAAALQLGRARREVLIVDNGQRRNRHVPRAHGILGHDGVSPGALAAKAKEEALAYPTVHWLDATVVVTHALPDGFALSAGGEINLAKRVILATGVVDDIPAIPGIPERWGKTVFHCPYCDGYELDRGKLGVLASGPSAVHYAAIVAEWGRPGETVLFLNGGPELAPAEQAELVSRRIGVESERLVEGRDAPMGLELVVVGERRYQLAGLFTLPRTSIPGDFARQLGCEVEIGPTGPMYKTDPQSKETTVPGVFACGDAALAQASVSYAIADGVRAGTSAHQSLIFERSPKTKGEVAQ